jgi:hypothetical protein
VTRGQRNRNPGNIRISDAQWLGKVPPDDNTDGAFEQFGEMWQGVRALLKLLKGYIERRGCTTIETIIRRYAPENENDTGAYIASVCAYTGLPKDRVLGFGYPVAKLLVFAICYHENGREVITMDDFQAAWASLNPGTTS